MGLVEPSLPSTGYKCEVQVQILKNIIVGEQSIHYFALFISGANLLFLSKDSPNMRHYLRSTDLHATISFLCFFASPAAGLGESS